MGQRSPLTERLDAIATPAIEARNIVKSFGPNPVLKNVSMSIPVGGARALVGRNGAGKSTLVGVLTGLLTPDSGDVAFDSSERSIGLRPSRNDGLHWYRQRE